MTIEAVETRLVSTLSGKRREDQLAVESPLEIRLGFGPREARRQMVLAITMRTPGEDEDLATGFLIGEGLIEAVGQIRAIGPCGQPGESLRVELSPDLAFDPEALGRHFYTSSSCGVCGKTALEAVSLAGGRDLAHTRFEIHEGLLHRLPEQLAIHQPAFRSTGGLHAAALFDQAGALQLVREDVGRHNAVDKLVGAAARNGQVPLDDRGLLLSGRASFELIQKAVMAGIPMVAAIGAPSSLAAEAAERFGITLVAFLRNGDGNVYSHGRRVLSG